MSKKVFLCSISNISSGRCSEDCKFCTQSIKYKADIDRYYKKPIIDIVNEAKKAKKNKAVGFCLVTATKKLDDKTLDFLCQTASAVKKEVGDDMSLIGCAGMASVDALKELKKHGVENYNHNLETSKDFYHNVCTTHSWQDRFDTCMNVKESGLYLCAGGIFGLGETHEDRISMLESLRELEPMSAPINFYHPNDALPLEKSALSRKEAFECISLARSYLPNTMLMIAGGREITFGDEQYDIFKYGANSMIIGDYLTTNGEDTLRDIKAIENLGYVFARSCHEMAEE